MYIGRLIVITYSSHSSNVGVSLLDIYGVGGIFEGYHSFRENCE